MRVFGLLNSGEWAAHLMMVVAQVGFCKAWMYRPAGVFEGAGNTGFMYRDLMALASGMMVISLALLVATTCVKREKAAVDKD